MTCSTTPSRRRSSATSRPATATWASTPRPTPSTAWPWYGQLVGAYFRNHPNGTPTATVVVEDADAPSPRPTCRRAGRASTSGTTTSARQPGGQRRRHGLQRPQHSTAIHVLLTMDESTYAEADGSDGVDDDHPIAWCQRYDGGRAVVHRPRRTPRRRTSTPAFLAAPAGRARGRGRLRGRSGVRRRRDATRGRHRRHRAGDAVAHARGAGRASGRSSRASPGTTTSSTGRQRDLDRDGRRAVGPRPELHGHRPAREPDRGARPAAGGQGDQRGRPSGAFAPLRTDRSPLRLLAYAGPVSNDPVTIGFRQSIGGRRAAADRAPTAKTLVFTLSTSTP